MDQNFGYPNFQHDKGLIQFAASTGIMGFCCLYVILIWISFVDTQICWNFCQTYSNEIWPNLAKFLPLLLLPQFQCRPEVNLLDKVVLWNGKRIAVPEINGAMALDSQTLPIFKCSDRWSKQQTKNSKTILAPYFHISIRQHVQCGGPVPPRSPSPRQPSLHELRRTHPLPYPRPHSGGRRHVSNTWWCEYLISRVNIWYPDSDTGKCMSKYTLLHIYIHFSKKHESKFQTSN